MNLRDDTPQPGPRSPQADEPLRDERLKRGDAKEADAQRRSGQPPVAPGRPAEVSDERIAATHPLGTGLGALGGATAGAAIGSIGGPLGSAIGGIIGAIAGGAAGHGIAENIDPSAEDAYWRENYRNQPFHSGDYDYSDYEPAFRLGYLNYPAQVGRTYEDAENDLASDWDKKHRGKSRLGWHEAKPAARAAWHRVQARHLAATTRDESLERVDDDRITPLADDDDDDFSIVDDQRGKLH
jgi:hypothetical protein